MRAGITAVLGILLTSFLVGCGSSLTGGSVPTGPTRMEGTVFLSSDTSARVTDAMVILTTSEGVALQTTSNTLGTFSFDEIPAGRATLVVVPPPADGLLPTAITIEIAPNSVASVALALEPIDPSIRVSAVSILPSSAVLRVGQSVRFEAEITGTNVAGLSPTWVVDGGVGEISPDGVFVATRQGRGQISAFLRGIGGSAEVNVQ